MKVPPNAMNATRGPTRNRYLARTMEDFTTKVLNPSRLGRLYLPEQMTCTQAGFNIGTLAGCCCWYIQHTLGPSPLLRALRIIERQEQQGFS
jgi:hypothetical protein